MKATTTVTVNDEDIKLIIFFNYYPADKGVYQHSNGDPGTPPSDDRVEVTDVSDAECGTNWDFDTLPSDVQDAVEQACYEHARAVQR